MTTRYPQYQALIQQRLSPKRYKHSLNVMERAVYLARIIPPGGRICPRWKKRCIWRI